MAVITKTDLENAKLDAADLGDFLNAASADVVPRTGSAYPNIRKIIDKLSDGGGLRVFENEETLQEHEPELPTLALVMSDPVTAWKFDGSLPWVEAPEYFEASSYLARRWASLASGEPDPDNYPGELSSYQYAVTTLKTMRVPCDVAITSSNYWTLTPKSGYTVNGTDQEFEFTAPAANTGAVTVVVTGLNTADPRYIRLFDTTTDLPNGMIPASGRRVVIKYNPANGHFLLLSPDPIVTNYVPLLQVNNDEAVFQCRITDGVVIKDSATAVFIMKAPSDRQLGEFVGVTLEIEGFNTGDPRQVLYPSGDIVLDQIGQNAWMEDDLLEFTFSPSGAFHLLRPLRPEIIDAGRPSSAFLELYSNLNGALNAQAQKGN